MGPWDVAMVVCTVLQLVLFQTYLGACWGTRKIKTNYKRYV